MSNPIIGLVCGMRSELETLGRWREHGRVLWAVSGARPAEAERAARRLSRAGATMLVSYGVAGGLDPSLPPGALLTPEETLDEPRAREGAEGAVTPLSTTLRDIGAADGRIIGVDQVIATPQEKAYLHALGGRAIDMETHRVARIGRQAGLPVAALRAVADPARRALPKAALGGLGPDGAPRIAPVLAGLALRPTDFAPLMEIKRDVDCALAALTAAADRAMRLLLDAA